MLNQDGLIQALAATVEAMGQTATPAALVLMADDLSGFDESGIVNALKSTRKKGGRFQISTVLGFLEDQDGRPSVDKAWALMPKDESGTAVITQEMAEAWGVAQEMYLMGDTVGAQIAFKREYSRLIAEGREAGERVSWFPSLGEDRSSRDDALIEAAADGRLGVDQVKGMVDAKSLPRLAHATGDDVLLLEVSKERKATLPNDADRKTLEMTALGRECLEAARNAAKSG